MSLRSRIAELQVAAMLLTRLPAGRISGPVPALSEAQWAYPLMGLPVGLVSWLSFAASLAAGLPEPVAAMLFLSANALVTGALHHDGLADLADGLGGGRDRTHCLEIMRDSRVGSYGVLALILALGCQAASLSSLGPELSLPAVLAIFVGSRLGMLVVIQAIPSARSDGLGRSAGGGSPGALVVGGAVAIALLAFADPSCLVAVLASSAGLAVLALMAQRRIGGYTGDVLGAGLFVFETVAFVSLTGSLA